MEKRDNLHFKCSPGGDARVGGLLLGKRRDPSLVWEKGERRGAAVSRCACLMSEVAESVSLIYITFLNIHQNK